MVKHVFPKVVKTMVKVSKNHNMVNTVLILTVGAIMVGLLMRLICILIELGSCLWCISCVMDQLLMQLIHYTGETQQT